MFPECVLVVKGEASTLTENNNELNDKISEIKVFANFFPKHFYIIQMKLH